MAQIVKTTAGAIGYVDYADAKASGLTWASVKNQAGSYIAPSTQSATAAADNATIKPDLTFSAIWASGASSYPITYQSWDLVYQKQSSSIFGNLIKIRVPIVINLCYHRPCRMDSLKCVEIFL